MEANRNELVLFVDDATNGIVKYRFTVRDDRNMVVDMGESSRLSRLKKWAVMMGYAWNNAARRVEHVDSRWAHYHL